jgi:S1-C subfamily serine protease
MTRITCSICLVGLSLGCAGCGHRDKPAVGPDTVTTIPDVVAAPGQVKDAPAPVNAPPAVPSSGTATPGNESSPAARELVRKAKRFTALVEASTVKDGNPSGRTGTAFCIDRSGLFVTHAQVVESVTQEKGQVRLILDNDEASRRVYFAKLLRSDTRSGLALLEINPDPELNLEPLAMADEAQEAVELNVDSVTYPVGRLDVPAGGNARPGNNVARFRFNYSDPYFFRFPDVNLRRGRVTEVRRNADRTGLLFLEYDGNNGPEPGAPVLDRAGKLVGVAGPLIFGGRYTHCAVPATDVAAFLKSTRSGADLTRAGDVHLEVVRKGRQATALVETDTSRGKASGSAFCVASTGLFITNAHVVKNAKDVRLVLNSGEANQRVIRAEVLRRDDVVDLALLQGDVHSGLEPLEIALDADLYQTMEVLTFGFPFGTLLAFDSGDRGKFPEVSSNVSRVTMLESVIVLGVFDLRLVPSVEDQSNLPTRGKNLIVLALVHNVLHLRIFDENGNKVEDTDENHQYGVAKATIAQLKSKLNSLWGVTEIPLRDKDSIVTAVASILGHTHKRELGKVVFDGQLNPGNSGGPVLGPDGKVVGVATATILGASINFAIPAGRLSAFLKAPGLMVSGPDITWGDRAARSKWRFTVVPPTPKDVLPQNLSVAVTVADGIGKPREFRAEPSGSPGDFTLEFVPVPRDHRRKIEVSVRTGDRVQHIDVEDVPLKVKGREFLLGDLHHVALAPSVWAYTVQDELIKGPIDGLGVVEGEVYGSGNVAKPGRIDLSKASEMSVQWVWPDRAVQSLQVTARAMPGGETGQLVCGYSQNFALRGAPTNAGPGRRRPGPPHVVTRLRNPVPIELEGRLEFGGELDARGIPRGSARSIRPPKVDMARASIDEGSGAGPGSRAINLPASVQVAGAAFSHDETLVAVSCAHRHTVPMRGSLRLTPQQREADAAQARSNGKIRIFELATGREVQALQQGQDAATELAFSADGSQLVTWRRGRGLVEWDLKTGGRSTKSREPLFADVDSLKIAPDGRRVLTYSLTGRAVTKTLRLCDAATGKVLNAFSSQMDTLYSVAADWKRLVTFDYRPQDRPRFRPRDLPPREPAFWLYKVVEIETGRVLSQGQVENGNPKIFSPDPATCVLHNHDNSTQRITVIVCDLDTGAERRRFRIDPFSTVAPGGVLGLTPDGKQLLGVCSQGVDGGQLGDVAIFSLGTGAEVTRIKTGSQNALYGSTMSPSGRNAAIFGSGVCWLWAINEESGQPRTPAAPRRSASPLVRWTAGKIRDVAVGGGGRYLAVMLADARKVAIFDVNAADVVQTIPLASDDALLAAGARKLVIAYPGARRLERWDLETLRRDGELRPSPIEGVLKAIALGSDSDGPLLVCWSVATTKPAPVLDVRFSFIDLDSLKVLRVGLTASSPFGPTLSPSGGCFLTYGVRNGGVPRLCTSAGGAVFGLWAANDSPLGEATVLLAHGNTVSGILQPPRSYGVGYLIPGVDGKSVFTSRSGIITEPKFPHAALTEPKSPRDLLTQTYVPPDEPMFPSPDPAYSLSLRGGGSIAIRLTRDNSPLLTITGLAEMVGLTGRDESLIYDRISVEKRFHLVPAARLLVTIPTSNDRLVLRRLDIGDSLARLPGDFLFATSPPALTAKAGQPFRHRIDVLSKQGGVTWALDHGPEGLTVSTDGEVRWRVPRGLKGSEETATVTIGDSSGRKVIHKLAIQVE